MSKLEETILEMAERALEEFKVYVCEPGDIASKRSNVSTTFIRLSTLCELGTTLNTGMSLDGQKKLRVIEQKKSKLIRTFSWMHGYTEDK